MPLIDLPNVVQWAVPGFILLVALEMAYGHFSGKVRFEGRDTATSLIMGLGNSVIGGLTAGAFLVLSYQVWQWRLWDLGHAWWVFLLAFVLDDLAYYWIHRLGHRMRWMWAAHVIHHSSQHYNLSTALRQTWTGKLTPGFLIRWPLFLIGIEPVIVLFVAGLNLIYQFWIHTEAIRCMPRWFEAVMNTPSHHRVHHATNPRYLDANYAGVFIVWDKLFNTFEPERADDPPRYGLVRDIATFNPIRVAFHEWLGIFKDMASAESLKARLMFLLGPPGWTPDGSRQTSDMIKADWQRRQQGEAKTTADTESTAPTMEAAR
ncbi:sterol desaturase family protein [Yunchengibacter salinarum]|uniref:sterol desaturase family protein n=1 Tax=Yunchengibacter salinarum TaxID=3133399 RepID=UPI0035B5EA0C